MKLFNIEVSKGNIFKISIISYTSILLGVIVNNLFTVLYGVNCQSYISLSAFLYSSSKLINVILMKVNMFEIASVIIFASLLTKEINGTNKDKSLIIIYWYIIDIIVIYYFY